MNVSIEAALLARMHAVLAQVITVISRVKDISILEVAFLFKEFDHFFYTLIDGLKRPES